MHGLIIKMEFEKCWIYADLVTMEWNFKLKDCWKPQQCNLLKWAAKDHVNSTIWLVSLNFKL